MTGPLTWSPPAGDPPTLMLEGDITEHADLGGLLDALDKAVVIDAAGVRRINSCGVRDWIDFLGRAEEKGVHIILRRCAVPLVSQLNMITTFKGHCRIVSVMAPYVCAACDEETAVEVDLAQAETIDLTQGPACPACAEAGMEFDDLEDQYLAFARR